MSPTTKDVSRSRGPVSVRAERKNSPTLIATAWRRGKAKINRILGNTPPEPPKSPCSTPFPSTFPYDVVEMIIAHLARYPPTLKACSLTCHSWYTAAVPHLHQLLTLIGDAPYVKGSRPESLSKLHELGLIHLVKEVRVRQGPGEIAWFMPRAFDQLELRYFFALANVHTLAVENLQIDRFIQTVEHHFGHLSATLRSIALYDPWCTPRQLAHFLAFFPNLDDIQVQISVMHNPVTAIPDPDPVPFPVQKPRGRLALYRFTWTDTWTHLITLCGGLGFRHLDLRLKDTSCAPLLLKACAKTVETLRMDGMESTVGGRPPSGPKLDLSGLTALRSLQVASWAGRRLSGDRRHTIVAEVFSTIKSPVFSELVIIISGCTLTYLSQEITFFETLRKMNVIRPFKLVFFLVDWDNDREGGGVGVGLPPMESAELLREWGEAMDTTAARKGFLDFYDPPPTAHIIRCRSFDQNNRLSFQPN